MSQIWLCLSICFMALAVLVLIVCDYLIIRELTNTVDELKDEVKELREHTVKELKLTRYHIGEVDKKVKK